jgi:hypothetical protein
MVGPNKGAASGTTGGAKDVLETNRGFGSMNVGEPSDRSCGTAHPTPMDLAGVQKK